MTMAENYNSPFAPEAMQSASPGQSVAISVGEVFRFMPLTFRHWLVGAALFISFVIEAWEMMVVILAGDMIAADLHLSTEQLGNLFSSIYIGMIPGCLIWGKISDAIGRKKTVVWSLVLYGVMSGASAFSHSYGMLWWTRLASGVALSGVLVAPFIHLEELLPVRHRGRGAVILAAGWPVGLLLAIGVVHVLRGTNWHVILAVSSLAGLWAIGIQKIVPESPYWAASRGKRELASRSIAALYGSQAMPFPAESRFIVDNFEQGSFTRLFEPALRTPTVQQLLMNAMMAFSTWALTAWLPRLLADRGLSVTDGDAFLTFTAIVMFPGYITASWATGKFGRRRVMAVFVALAAIFSFSFAFSQTLWQMYLSSAGLFFFNQGAWGVWDTWMGELYPTSVRGVGYSLGLTMQRVANSFAPFLIGIFLSRRASFSFVVCFIACFLVAALFISMSIRETEGVVLD
jgi:putative MFS transporter